MVTLRYFQDEPNPPPWLKALAQLRRLAAREGWCYQHVQAKSRGSQRLQIFEQCLFVRIG